MASKIETKKQQVKLPHEGHLYTFDKMSVDGATKFWRCEFKDSVNKCKGRLWTDLNNHFIRLSTPHTCPANASNVEAQQVKTTIKLRAITTLEPPSVIRSEALQNVPSPAAILVTKRAANDLIKRARHEINAPPAVPTNLNFEINQAYRTYTSTEGVEELFLLGDSGVYFENGNENPQRYIGSAAASNTGCVAATPAPCQHHMELVDGAAARNAAASLATPLGHGAARAQHATASQSAHSIVHAASPVRAAAGMMPVVPPFHGRTRWTPGELVLLRRLVTETEGMGSLFGLRRAAAIRNAAPEDSRLRTMRNTQVHNQVRYLYRGPHPPLPNF